MSENVIEQRGVMCRICNMCNQRLIAGDDGDDGGDHLRTYSVSVDEYVFGSRVLFQTYVHSVLDPILGQFTCLEK